MAEAVRFAEENSIDIIVTPIVNPLYSREFINQDIADRHKNFSRSDLILHPSMWMTKIVAKISDYIECDSNDSNVRTHSSATLEQEMGFAQHLAAQGYMLIPLRDTNTLNLARVIARNLSGTMLIEVPMVDPKSLSSAYRNSGSNWEETTGDDTWQWWNKFRTYADYHPRIKIALELSADLPSREHILRWLGEPLELLIIHSDIFILNRKNYPVLSKAHQAVVIQFIRMGVNLALKTTSEDQTSLKNYVDYLKHLIAHNRGEDIMHGYDDLLEIPLQPLYDNLDSYTYEIFERDPIKYIFYQKAIEQALIDKIDENDIEKKTAIVMVVGAGRGPLVRSAINASINTKRKIKMYVIEKNPNAIITLTSLKEEMWADRDLTIISTDMRDFTPRERADILVSELLGSFGDNELSPECLDGAQKHLKEDGISIPCKSTSYINPVMTQKLMNIMRETRVRYHRQKPSTIDAQCESSYVVYLKNAYHIAPAKPLFTFVHPNKDEFIDNSRYEKVTFQIDNDCLLNGFAGYFDTVLYKDIVLSIHPETHSKGLSSWFSMFFPLAEPQHLKAGDVVEVHFWRCISDRKVWYEWSTSAPQISHIHNFKGRACPIYK